MIDLLKKIPRKIKFVSQDVATYVLIKFSVFINSPVLAARFASWFVKEVNSTGQYRVLCMRRTIFMDDVRAMSQMSGRLHYLVISRRIFQIIFFHFADKAELQKLTDNNYHSGQYCQKGIKKYYAFLKKMLPRLQQLINFDAIFSCNLVYIEQQEISRVAENLHLPYIVLHKESLTAGIYEDSAIAHAGCRFLGAKLLTYNETLASLLVEVLGPNGITKDKTQVVGVPRYDCLFKQNNEVSVKNQIVFFSFYPKVRFPRIIKDQETLAAIYQRAEDFYVWVMRFAKNHPNIDLIIKTKTAKYYLNYIYDILHRNFKDPITNITITSRGNSIEIIKSSLLVCAFSSMTIMESLLLDKVIVSPYFGDLIPDQPWDYFDEAPQMVNYVKTEQEFQEQLLRPKKRYKAADRDRFLRRFIYLPDGQASKRAEDEIIKVINSYKNVKR